VLALNKGPHCYDRMQRPISGEIGPDLAEGVGERPRPCSMTKSDEILPPDPDGCLPEVVAIGPF